MTPQQIALAVKFRRLGITIRELSKRTGIEHTRVWRVTGSNHEMKVSEYIKLIALYKELTGAGSEKDLFFLGESNDSDI